MNFIFNLHIELEHRQPWKTIKINPLTTDIEIWIAKVIGYQKKCPIETQVFENGKWYSSLFQRHTMWTMQREIDYTEQFNFWIQRTFKSTTVGIRTQSIIFGSSFWQLIPTTLGGRLVLQTLSANARTMHSSRDYNMVNYNSCPDLCQRQYSFLTVDKAATKLAPHL